MTPIIETINLKNPYLLEQVTVAARRKLERRTNLWYCIFLVSSDGGNHVLLEDFGQNLKKVIKGEEIALVLNGATTR